MQQLQLQEEGVCTGAQVVLNEICRKSSCRLLMVKISILVRDWNIDGKLGACQADCWRLAPCLLCTTCLPTKYVGKVSGVPRCLFRTSSALKAGTFARSIQKEIFGKFCILLYNLVDYLSRLRFQSSIKCAFLCWWCPGGTYSTVGRNLGIT